MTPSSRPLIALVAAEAVPFVKVGGLGDVVGALARGMRRWFKTALFLPLHRQVRDALRVETVAEFNVVLAAGTTFRCSVAQKKDQPDVYFIGNDGLFDRPFVYGPPGADYPDSLTRFAFFCASVLHACRTISMPVDCFHCHDWHAALLPVYLRERYRDVFPGATTVLTIHNLAHQGIASAASFWSLGLPDSWWSIDGLEFYGATNPLKAGILTADRITTVSRHYAEEILTEEFGCGLQGVLAKRRDALTGIRNGLDYRLWNPRFDRHIRARYASPAGKRVNRESLTRALNLDTRAAGPLFGFVGRIVDQKGIDLILSALDTIIACDGNLVILGDGTPEYVSRCREACARFPGRAVFEARFDEHLARAVYAGCDIFLMPSRFEPCGIGQLIAMKYGAVPIVTRVGGLADTVVDVSDGGWGLLCEPSRDSLVGAVQRACALFSEPPRWDEIVRRAMAQDFSWKELLETYRRLFADLTGRCR